MTYPELEDKFDWEEEAMQWKLWQQIKDTLPNPVSTRHKCSGGPIHRKSIGGGAAQTISDAYEICMVFDGAVAACLLREGIIASRAVLIEFIRTRAGRKVLIEKDGVVIQIHGTDASVDNALKLISEMESRHIEERQ